MSSMAQKRTVTVQTASAEYDVAPSTLRLWVREGRIRAHRVGRRVLIDARDLERFVRGERPTQECASDDAGE